LHHSKKKLEPSVDPKYQVQIVSSAIVNTPPPKAVLVAIRTLGRKRHKVSTAGIDLFLGLQRRELNPALQHAARACRRSTTL